MNKMIMNRLTMLAVALMASMACFAQGNGKMATSLINQPHAQGDIVDLFELRYYIVKASGEGGCNLDLEVIGFASDITGTESSVNGSAGNPNKVTDTYEGVLEINPHYPASEVGFNCQVISIAENAFTTTTCHGDNAKYKSKFADAAAKVNKIQINYDPSFDFSISIADNAFGGLTGVTEVENQTPGATIKAISANAFATTVYRKATLIAPAGGASKYAQTAGWNKFYKIKNGKTGVILGDINNDGDIDALDLKALRTAVLNKTYSLGADINGDGDVDALDLKQMRQVILRTY